MSLSTEQRAALEQAAHRYKLETGLAACGEGFLRGAEWMERNIWVPVTERLPGNGNFVQCTTKNGVVVYAAYGRGEWHTVALKEVDVIAWLERPAPYSPHKAENNAGTE